MVIVAESVPVTVTVIVMESVGNSDRERKIQRQSEAVTVTDKYSDIKRVRTEVTIIVRE